MAVLYLNFCLVSRTLHVDSSLCVSTVASAPESTKFQLFFVSPSPKQGSGCPFHPLLRSSPFHLFLHAHTVPENNDQQEIFSLRWRPPSWVPLCKSCAALWIRRQSPACHVCWGFILFFPWRIPELLSQQSINIDLLIYGVCSESHHSTMHVR